MPEDIEELFEPEDCTMYNENSSISLIHSSFK